MSDDFEFGRTDQANPETTATASDLPWLEPRGDDALWNPATVPVATTGDGAPVLPRRAVRLLHDDVGTPIFDAVAADHEALARGLGERDH